MLHLSSPIWIDLPLLANILRDYTLEFVIIIKRALIDLRECLREAVRDKDYCREITDTFMEHIEEISNEKESELTTFRAELYWKGPTPPGTKVECIQLRSRVMGLEDELMAFTRRFVTLDHT